MKIPGNDWHLGNDLDFIINSLKSIASYDVENLIVQVSINATSLTQVLLELDPGALVTSFIDMDFY